MMMATVSLRSGSLVLAGLLSALAAAGCGRNLPAAVSGTVTLDGTPLSTGLVTFLPVTSGPAAYGPIGTEGQFAVQTGGTQGLEPGDYVVTVAANASPGSAVVPAPPPGTARPKFADPILPLITPPTYAVKDTSPLRATVKPGNQTLDFDLRSK